MTDYHGRYASAQALLPLDDIQGDMLRLRGGGYRAVLEAGSVNVALRSAAEQEAIVTGYRAFLNALRYPIQILVRVLPTDIEAYLAGLRGAGTRGRPLARLALDHEAFVRRLARERTLLERRFYVVVLADEDGNGRQDGRPASPATRLLPWRPWSANGGLPAPVAAQQLASRCEEVRQGLAGFGVTARRLGEGELAELWYAMLTPDRARLQPLSAVHGPVAILTHGMPGGVE
jgi:hypothetical protein